MSDEKIPEYDESEPMGIVVEDIAWLGWKVYTTGPWNSLPAGTELYFKPRVPAVGELPPLPAPLEINWPELHSQALGCGIEDRNIRDRYEAAEYGWEDGVDKAAFCVPEDIFTSEQMQDYARAAVQAAQSLSMKQALAIWKACSEFDTGPEGMEVDEYEAARDREIKRILEQ